MSCFLQLHYLTIYPLSNPNRDDLGRPKTAVYGGAPRLRISSQALKRAARESDVIKAELEGQLGTRTQRIGEVVREALAGAASEDQVTGVAKKVTDIFGTLDSKKVKEGKIRTKQLAFISPEERSAAIELARKALAGEALPELKQLKKQVLRTADGAADLAHVRTHAGRRSRLQPRGRRSGQPRAHHPPRAGRGRLLYRRRRLEDSGRGLRRGFCGRSRLRVGSVLYLRLREHRLAGAESLRGP